MLYLAINYFRIGIQNELQYRVNFFVQLGQSSNLACHRTDRLVAGILTYERAERLDTA